VPAGVEVPGAEAHGWLVGDFLVGVSLMGGGSGFGGFDLLLIRVGGFGMWI